MLDCNANTGTHAECRHSNRIYSALKHYAQARPKDLYMHQSSYYHLHVYLSAVVDTGLHVFDQLSLANFRTTARCLRELVVPFHSRTNTFFVVLSVDF